MSTNQPNTQSNSDPQQPNEPAIAPLPVVSSTNQPAYQNPMITNQNIITNQNNDSNRDIQEEKQRELQEGQGEGQGQGQGQGEEAQGEGQVKQNQQPDIEDEGQQKDEEYQEQQEQEEQLMQAQGNDHHNDPEHEQDEQQHGQQQRQDKENDQNKGKGGENEGEKMQNQNIDKNVHQQHEQKKSQMIDEGHSVLKSPSQNTPNIQQQKNPEPPKPRQIPKPDNQLQPSQQTQSQPVHTTHTTHPQPHKQSYLNHLQCQLRLKQSESFTQCQQIRQQKTRIYNLQQQVQLLRKSNLDREKQMKELQTMRRQMESQGVRLEARVQELEQELGKYRQIGDVRVMQARINQLQTMIQIQKQQILTITQSTPTTPPQQSLNPHQFLQKLSSLQENLQQKQSKLKLIQIKYQNLLSEHNENLLILQNMDNKLKQNIQRINQLQDLLEKEKQIGSELRGRVVELEGKMGGEEEEEEEYGRRGGKAEEERSRDMENQKDIVFREYLKMEANFKNLEESQRDLKAKYHQVCRQLRTAKKQMIPKKDYQQLYQKYKKTKTCLQKSLSNPSNSISTSHPLSQAPPSVPNPHLDSLSTHLQQCHTYLSKSSQLLTQQQIQNYKLIDKKKQKIINQLTEKNQRLSKINLLYQRQIQYKGEIIDRLVLDGQKTKEEVRKWKEEKGRILEETLGDVGVKWRLARVETKAANLLIRNRKILTQKDNWKNLYEQLKYKFDQFLSRNPTNQPQSANIQASQPQLQPYQSTPQPQSPPTLHPTPSTHQSQTQTQGLNQLYYKQIKQTLSTLKRIPQLIKTTTNNYQKIGKQLEEYKKKYEQTNEKYNMKFKGLIAQKSQNDAWRDKEKKNILMEFQDLRDIVDGDRLMSCLRKAKNLIQYLEGGNEEEGEIVGE